MQESQIVFLCFCLNKNDILKEEKKQLNYYADYASGALCRLQVYKAGSYIMYTDTKSHKK